MANVLLKQKKNGQIFISRFKKKSLFSDLDTSNHFFIFKFVSPFTFMPPLSPFRRHLKNCCTTLVRKSWNKWHQTIFKGDSQVLTNPWYLKLSQMDRSRSQKGQRYSKRNSRTQSAASTTIQRSSSFTYTSVLLTGYGIEKKLRLASQTLL